jgi:hypothetical protein
MVDLLLELRPKAKSAMPRRGTQAAGPRPEITRLPVELALEAAHAASRQRVPRESAQSLLVSYDIGDSS